MNDQIFDSAFFGWSNLPESIVIEGENLIPVKVLKLKCKSLDVNLIRNVCKFVGIQLHRPVKGLYCIKEEDSKFFSFLDRAINLNLNYLYSKDYVSLYQQFIA
jgi:hypothetical protein